MEKFWFAILLTHLLTGCAPRALLEKEGLSLSVEPRTIFIEASNYKFTPKTIEVKTGEKIELHIESTQGVHGFKCPALGINETVRPDRPVAVRFAAKKPGRVKFHCSHFCGWGHFFMRGKIVVKD